MHRTNVTRLQMIKNCAIRQEAIKILAICASTPGVNPFKIANVSGEAATLAVQAYVAAEPIRLNGCVVYAEAECLLREGWEPKNMWVNER